MTSSDAGPIGDAAVIRDRLAGERHRLLAVLAAAEEDGPPAPSAGSGELSTADQHPADRATEMQYAEQEESIVEAVRAELAEVDAAERRLDEGTYGRCQVCGRPIDPARLETRPATRFCRADA